MLGGSRAGSRPPRTAYSARVTVYMPIRPASAGPGTRANLLTRRQNVPPPVDGDTSDHVAVKRLLSQRTTIACRALEVSISGARPKGFEPPTS